MVWVGLLRSHAIPKFPTARIEANIEHAGIGCLSGHDGQPLEVQASLNSKETMSSRLAVSQNLASWHDSILRHAGSGQLEHLQFHAGDDRLPRPPSPLQVACCTVGGPPALPPSRWCICNSGSSTRVPSGHICGPAAHQSWFEARCLRSPSHGHARSWSAARRPALVLLVPPVRRVAPSWRSSSLSHRPPDPRAGP